MTSLLQNNTSKCTHSCYNEKAVELSSIYEFLDVVIANRHKNRRLRTNQATTCHSRFIGFQLQVYGEVPGSAITAVGELLPLSTLDS
jgi:hypothetical protein